MKKNYIATAICDGIKKHFTVHNVTDGRATKVAISIGESLFCASRITILELELIN